MPPTNVKRGDIFYVELPEHESQGSEQHGRRPCVVVSANLINDRFNIAVVVPLSSVVTKANRQHRILIPEQHKLAEPGTCGCPGESIALCEQIRMVSKMRLDNVRVAHLTATAMGSVEAGISYVLNIGLG